jgi:tRNA(Ile)-lysidine synthetase-like protein
VRNWRAGDSFHAAFSKGPKKVKELLQAMHLQPEAKAIWPVIVCGDAIVWGRGFPLSQASRQAEGAARVVVIAEVPDSEELGPVVAENQ